MTNESGDTLFFTGCRDKAEQKDYEYGGYEDDSKIDEGPSLLPSVTLEQASDGLVES